MLNADLVNVFLSALNVISTFHNTAVAVKSASDRKHFEIGEENIRNAFKIIRQNADSLREGLEDYVYLLEKIDPDQKKKYFSEPFKNGIFIYLQNSEFEEYASIKTEVDRSACKLFAQLNLILKLVSSTNHEKAMIICDLMEESQRVVSSALIERVTVGQVRDETIRFLRNLSEKLRESRGNR